MSVLMSLVLFIINWVFSALICMIFKVIYQLDQLLLLPS